MVAPTRLGLSPKRANASRITEGRFGKSRCGYHLSRPTDSPYDRLAGPSREALVDDRLVPVARNIEPLVDQRLKLRLGEAGLERVEPIDHLAHQVAHLVIVEPRHGSPGNAIAVGVDDEDIGIVAGLRDRDRAGMQVLQHAVADADHRHRLGERRR